MCSIVVGTITSEVRELAKLNASRGVHSHSLAYFSEDCELINIEIGLGELDYESIDIPRYAICVLHQQAPTSENKDIKSIHPAQIGSKMLWHNGILKENTIKKLQLELESYSTWDTKLLLQSIINNDYDVLNRIDGSFACVMVHNGWIDIFRNEISPLYYSPTAISSVEFSESKSVPPNQIFYLDIKNNQTEYSQYKNLIFKLETFREPFETAYNPYFFGE